MQNSTLSACNNQSSQYIESPDFRGLTVRMLIFLWKCQFVLRLGLAFIKADISDVKEDWDMSMSAERTSNAL